MIELRFTSVATLMAAAMILAPAGASAQLNDATVYRPRPVDFTVRAGAAIPADHLQDFTNIGLNVGADAAWHLTNRFALRIDGDYDGLPGQKNIPIAPAHGLPDMQLYHVGAGLQFDLGPERAGNAWFVTTDVGAGATRLDTDTFLHQDGTRSSLGKTYPDVDAGVEVGYHLADNVTAAVGGQGLIAFTKKSDLMPLTEIDPAGRPFNQALVFPITATVSVALP